MFLFLPSRSILLNFAPTIIHAEICTFKFTVFHTVERMKQINDGAVWDFRFHSNSSSTKWFILRVNTEGRSTEAKYWQQGFYCSKMCLVFYCWDSTSLLWNSISPYYPSNLLEVSQTLAQLKMPIQTGSSAKCQLPSWTPVMWYRASHTLDETTRVCRGEGRRRDHLRMVGLNFCKNLDVKQSYNIEERSGHYGFPGLLRMLEHKRWNISPWSHDHDLWHFWRCLLSVSAQKMPVADNGFA